MEQRPQVFISYSRRDQVFVERLVESLESQGCSVFYDGLVGIGENWVKILHEVLEGARFVLAVMSPSYFAASGARNEWGFALERELREKRVVLLPVMYRDCVLPDALIHKRWADFREPSDFHRALGSLVLTIRGSPPKTEGTRHILPPTPVEYPEELIQSIQSGNAILYCGAGLSALAGLPTWQQFAERLVDASATADLIRDRDRQFFEDALRDLKTDYVVDEVIGRVSGDFIEQFLSKTFLGKRPSAGHEVLRQLFFAAALTTNFDNLLEITFGQNGNDLPVYTPQDTELLLGAFARRSFFVLKLYGSLDRPKEVLVSPAQFDKAISENLPFQSFMDSLFVSRTILFVGCSLEGIETYLRGLRFRTQSNSRHYALSGVLGTSWEATAGVLERRYGIRVIPYRKDDGQDLLRALQILQEKVGNEGSNLSFPTTTSPLKKIVLTNIGPFEQQEITLDPQTNLFLGNNGVGKSTILRALAIALCGKDAKAHAGRLIRSGATSASIQLETEHGIYQTILQSTSGPVELTSPPVGPLESEGWLAVGFPALRTTSGKRIERDSVPFPSVKDVLPLAMGDADLRLDDLQTWIADMDYRAKHEQSLKTGNDRYERLIQTFFDTVADLLEGVKLEFKGVDPSTKQITVVTDDGPVPFEYVSQGTSSLVGWVGVLLQRLFEIYGDDSDPRNRYALVLMDEIDAHMHPSWQQILLPRIRKHFPNLQLIATTHSPLILNGLEDRNVMHVVRSPKTHQVEIKRYEMKLKGLESDQILTGPLFGLEDTRDLETQKDERRYDELRSLPSPNVEQIAERESLAQKLFGSRSTHLASASKTIYKALETSIQQNLETTSAEEQARQLSEAERLIEKIIAGR